MRYLHLVVEFANRAELKRVHGDALLRTVEEATLWHTQSICADLGMAAILSRGEIRIQALPRILQYERTYPDHLHYQDLEEVMARLCGRLACTRDAASMASLHAAVVGAPVLGGALEPVCPKTSMAFTPSPVNAPSVEWALSAIMNDAASFLFQPVIDSTEGTKIHYQEALVRIPSADGGRVMSPQEFVPFLEQSHLVRILDRYAVKRVIGMLKLDPMITLGVNISAKSAVEDLWWASTMLELTARPDIAKRLVLEITEVSPSVRGSAQAFARHIQGLGCRIAIDDFGAGYSIETAIEIGKADLIKLDKKFIANARNRANAGQLQSAVNFAKTLARDIVIEGVEDELALQCARSTGARCVQGYYLAMPSPLPVDCPV